jgi:hypothetical protein
MFIEHVYSQTYMFNKPASEAVPGLFNKSSNLAPVLGVTSRVNRFFEFGHTLLCCLSPLRLFC